jgi:uncharacterized protein
LALVLDTGPIVALLDAADPEHERCVAMVADVARIFVVPAPGGAYRLHHLDEDGVARAAEIERSYESLDLGFVDAAVMVTCERLGETKVATLDRRDFDAVRPRYCKSLTLLPE